MNFVNKKGFTLIELLTVIAIIAILAGLTMTVGPRMIERAKLRRLDSALREVATALTAYYVDHASYPPAYGYVNFEKRDSEPPADPSLDPGFYNLQPYMFRMKYHGNTELYDEFSASYDTDNDGRLSLLEYSPIGVRQPTGAFQMDFSMPRYEGNVTPEFNPEVTRQLEADRRPFIYIPVNLQQFSRAQRYWLNHGDAFASRWDPSDADFPKITFPPKNYDAFVLISVGPAANSFGLLPDPIGVEPSRDVYHITALRAYYMATRDLNANGQLDFDFRARTQQQEAGLTYNLGSHGMNNELPSATMPNGHGPYIYVSK